MVNERTHASFWSFTLKVNITMCCLKESGLCLNPVLCYWPTNLCWSIICKVNKFCAIVIVNNIKCLLAYPVLINSTLGEVQHCTTTLPLSPFSLPLAIYWRFISLNKAFWEVLYLHYVTWNLEQPYRLVNTISLILYILYALVSRHLKDLLLLGSGDCWRCQINIHDSDLLLGLILSCKSVPLISFSSFQNFPLRREA